MTTPSPEHQAAVDISDQLFLKERSLTNDDFTNVIFSAFGLLKLKLFLQHESECNCDVHTRTKLIYDEVLKNPGQPLKVRNSVFRSTVAQCHFVLYHDFVIAKDTAVQSQSLTTPEQPHKFALMLQIENQEQLMQALTTLQLADVQTNTYKQVFFDKVIKDKSILLKLRLVDTPSKVYKLVCSFNICDPAPHQNPYRGEPVTVLESLLPTIRSNLMRRISPEKEREVLFEVYTESGMTALMFNCCQTEKQIEHPKPGSCVYVKVIQSFESQDPIYTCNIEDHPTAAEVANAIPVTAFFHAFKAMTNKHTDSP
jgi:hypothetical protein